MPRGSGDAVGSGGAGAAVAAGQSWNREAHDIVVPCLMLELTQGVHGHTCAEHPELTTAVEAILSDIAAIRHRHDGELVVSVLAAMSRLQASSGSSGASPTASSSRGGGSVLEEAVQTVQQNGLALEHTCDTARSCCRVVLEAVRQNGLALQFAEESLRGDKTITMTAVRQNGLALQYASAFMRNNGPVVMMAVKQDGRAIQYASENLRRCEDTVGAAVQQDVEAAWHAADATRKRRTEADYGPARAARRAERAARHHARNIYGPADPNI